VFLDFLKQNEPREVKEQVPVYMLPHIQQAARENPHYSYQYFIAALVRNEQ